MDGIFGILAIAAAIAVVAYLVRGAGKLSEARARAIRREDQRRENLERALAKRMRKGAAPGTLMDLCDADIPQGLRFQKSEDVVWVAEECGYARTKKEISYAGRSSGLSFRVAKGLTLRMGGSRGRRIENESLVHADIGTLVLTTKHLYFQGEGKERFRIRLERLVSAEIHEGGLLVQRDRVRARPEFFAAHEARTIGTIMEWMENPDAADDWAAGDCREDDESDVTAAFGASEAERG